MVNMSFRPLTEKRIQKLLLQQSNLLHTTKIASLNDHRLIPNPHICFLHIHNNVQYLIRVYKLPSWLFNEKSK